MFREGRRGGGSINKGISSEIFLSVTDLAGILAAVPSAHPIPDSSAGM